VVGARSFWLRQRPCRVAERICVGFKASWQGLTRLSTRLKRLTGRRIGKKEKPFEPAGVTGGVRQLERDLLRPKHILRW
jgi:hypothetical protein